MSFAGALGTGLQGSGLRDVSPTSRATLFAVVGSVAAVNGFAGKIATAIHDQSLLSAVLDLGGVSAIVWFAIGSLFTISGDAPADRSVPLRPRDRGMAGLMLALNFVPINFVAAIGLLLCGAYLVALSPHESVDRRMGIVMLALTGPLIWGRFLLALFGPLLLSLDARVAGLLAGVPVQGNVVHFANGHGVLYVALGCSSVHNMSLAILLFVTITQILRLKYTPQLIATGCAAAFAMAAVNVLRLASLARFPSYFDLLHTGWGGTLYGALSFVIAGAVIVGGVRVALSR